MNIVPISTEQTLRIFSEESIPLEVSTQVSQRLEAGRQIADPEHLGEFVLGLMDQQSSTGIEQNFRHVVALGSSSVLLAWQLAGDLGLSRRLKEHEHTQGVLNVFDTYVADDANDPRDRLLKPTLSLQDIGKAHWVATTDIQERRRRRGQSAHNVRMAHNLFSVLPDDILSADEKTVAELLIGHDLIGTALYAHNDRNVSLEEAVAPALEGIRAIHAACPPDYKDKIDDYLLATYLADAGAHTMRAQYVDAATGQVNHDITPEIRYTADGQETKRSADYIFSEAPEDVDKLKLHLPKHLAVMHRLFPRHYV